jgi:hypothetical protein
MNKQRSHNQAVYTPQQHKSFSSALSVFLENECPQLGGMRTRQVLVQAIDDMRRLFFPNTSHLQPGQIVWTAVHKEAVGAYGKSIAKTELTPVILDLLKQDEIEQRAKGVKLRDIKIEATARLFTQAYEQNGVLTNAEIAILLKMSTPTVGKYIKIWEAQNEQTLPRRGTIHDMGPSITHKRIIIHKLYIEQKTVDQVARETNHSYAAIQRYIGDFRRVILCRQNGIDSIKIVHVLRMSKRLLTQYEQIIEDYTTQNKNLDEMMNFHPKIK